MAGPHQNRPKAILCDVNGTLVSLDPIGQRMQEAGLPASNLELWFAMVLRDGVALAAADGFATFAMIGAYHLKNMLMANGSHALKSPADLDKAVDHILDGFNDIAPHPDLLPAFKRLTEAGVKVASMTNGAKKFTEGFLKRSGLDQYVSHVMEVAEPGLWKPRKEAYLFAAKQLGLEPSQVMLVAMHPWDCNGAKNAGMQTAYVNRSGKAYPDLFAAPDLSVESFEDLAQQLTGS